jgi:hypothetical protein
VLHCQSNFIQPRSAQSCNVANANDDLLIVYSSVAMECQDYSPLMEKVEVSWPPRLICVLQPTQVNANIRLSFPPRVFPET